ncbi:MAG: DUF6116 family protein [Pseudomonadota bacterium]
MVLTAIRHFLERRRFPTLLIIGAALLVLNIIIPDALPFVDEILMLIATLLIGSLRKKKEDTTELKSTPPVDSN